MRRNLVKSVSKGAFTYERKFLEDLGLEGVDAEVFLDAVSAMLRSASLIHMALKLENQKNTTNGTYIYAAYEELIEVFEILDLKAVMSSDDYTNYINSAEIKNDAKFRGAVLAPIVIFLLTSETSAIFCRKRRMQVIPKSSIQVSITLLVSSNWSQSSMLT